MTSNQVSNAMNMENIRHNVATEDLNAKYYQLEEKKLALNDEWKRTDQSIQDEYNKAYIAYLNASLDEKQWYESQMASIQEKRILVERDHNVEMESINKQQLEEAQRSNVANELNRSTLAYLQQKELEYKKDALRLETSVQEQRLAQDRLQAVESFQLEQQKLAQQLQIENTRLSASYAELEAKLRESESKRNLTDTQKATSMVSAGGSLATTILNALIMAVTK